MGKGYTVERNTTMLISMLKEKGIRKVVASPGTTNICFVASLQNDPFFEVYSSVDERSAAYIACGLSVESGEPVVISCTGATASRNYIPALTEAYYRKIPIIAVTSTQPIGRIGHNIPQVMDRRIQMNDTVVSSVQIPTICNQEDEWAINSLLNKAFIKMVQHGGGPIHINLVTEYSNNFSVEKLPQTRVIKYKGLEYGDWPELPSDGAIGVFVGNHRKWSEEETAAVEQFCARNNAFVMCEHGSNYWGKYKCLPLIITNQHAFWRQCEELELVIDIGDIPGSYIGVPAREIWRVNPDGEVRDGYRKLTYVFEMSEKAFFNHYCDEAKNQTNTVFERWENQRRKILSEVPELPFSNAWVAQQAGTMIPSGAVLHLGILNSLRMWNYFDITEGTLCYSNTGGFGIDGCVSSLIGASLANPDKLYYGVVGDLAFFYDMNSLGNRHINNNLRLMVINNGCGTEFKNYNNNAAQFGDDADAFIAAKGHYGKKSRSLIAEYVKALGFSYLNAENKEEAIEGLEIFMNPESTASIVFEIFTKDSDESNALKLLNSIIPEHLEPQEDQKNEKKGGVSSAFKRSLKNVLGQERAAALKTLLYGK